MMTTMQQKPTVKRGDVALVCFPNSESAICRVIGSLPMTNVDEALKHTLGLAKL
jgi:hypothetical protein